MGAARVRKKNGKQQPNVLGDGSNMIGLCKPCSEVLQKQVLPNGSVKVGLSAEIGGISREWVWAQKVRNGVYEIQNIPMLTFGYSYGDHVRAKKTADGLIVQKVVKPSGDMTFGVLIETGKKIEKAVLEFLEATHCGAEGNGRNYWGVHIPVKNADPRLDPRLIVSVLHALHKTERVKVFCLSHDVFEHIEKDLKRSAQARAEYSDLQKKVESMFPKPQTQAA